MFSPLYSIRYCGVNTTFNNSNICTGANTYELFLASFLHIFTSLIITGFCSPVVGLSDRQKMEDFKQPVSVEQCSCKQRYIESDIPESHCLSCFSRTGPEMSRDSVFNILVHARTSWKLFVSFTGGLFTRIMICFQLGDNKNLRR